MDKENVEYETYSLCSFNKEMVERAMDETIYRKLKKTMEEFDSFIFEWRVRPKTIEENGKFRVRRRFSITNTMSEKIF